MSKNADLHKRRIAAIPRGVGNSLAVYAERAQNAELWDVEGRRYIDFASGIAVLNTGHVHPHVKAAMAAQLEKITHGCFQVTPYESYIALAEALNELAPGPTPKKTIFLSTGAEAVENAIKIARYARSAPRSSRSPAASTAARSPASASPARCSLTRRASARCCRRCSTCPSRWPITA